MDERRDTKVDELIAKAWIETAAQHAANEEYYRKERDKLQHVIDRARRQLAESSANTGLTFDLTVRTVVELLTAANEFRLLEPEHEPQAAVSYVERAEAARILALDNRGAPSLSPTSRMLIEAGRIDRARWLEAECDELRAEVARLKAQLDAADRRGRDTR